MMHTKIFIYGVVSWGHSKQSVVSHSSSCELFETG